MKIISPSHNILEHSYYPYRYIEKIARICYKSENAITESSAESFVKRLYESKHHAMLEHYRFIVEVEEHVYDLLISNEHHKYITFTDDGRYVISASARGFNDMFIAVNKDSDHDNIANNVIYCLDDVVHAIIRDYGCPELFHKHFRETSGNPIESYTVFTIKRFSELSNIEYKMHAWYSVHFICDRGVSHELVRHRDASFAQESTRYCNYSKGKYNNEITVIKPLFFDPCDDADTHNLNYDKWLKACVSCERIYMSLLKNGATPQEARSVLPNSLKTEIVITAQVYEWIHIFNLRVLGITGTPHPQMKEVMSPVYKEMCRRGYLTTKNEDLRKEYLLGDEIRRNN